MLCTRGGFSWPWRARCVPAFTWLDCMSTFLSNHAHRFDSISFSCSCTMHPSEHSRQMSAEELSHTQTNNDKHVAPASSAGTVLEQTPPPRAVALAAAVNGRLQEEHRTWVDDERAPNCCSCIYHDERDTADVWDRPLWQDVLWGRARSALIGYSQGCERGVESRDSSRYVDHEFDSGRGSPAPNDAWDDAGY